MNYFYHTARADTEVVSRYVFSLALGVVVVPFLTWGMLLSSFGGSEVWVKEEGFAVWG